MTELIPGEAVVDAMRRACHALNDRVEHLTALDQALGDGDMGITAGKAARALLAYVDANPADDLGRFLAGAGMAVNRAASSTMGTLLATAMMRAGKAVRGKRELTPDDLIALFQAADQGIQERGKAQLGDKTVVDALHPASEAFAAAMADGASLRQAGQKALAAAEEGRDRVTPLRSRIGRASWVGERTEGKVDPGCALFVLVMRAIVGD